MYYIVRTGFVLCLLTQEFTSLIFLTQIFNYFDYDDPFASLYLRGVSPSFPHPLQTAHLAVVEAFISIGINISCLIMLFRTTSLRDITQDKKSLMGLYISTTYQFIGNVTVLITSLTAIVLWRDTFANTFVKVTGCTFAKTCTARQNILDPWRAFLSLHDEWEFCLGGGVNFSHASIHRKLNLIENAYRRDTTLLVECLKNGYQQHSVSAMSNYILNSSLCTLIIFTHLIYLVLMFKSKHTPQHTNDDTTTTHSLQGLSCDFQDSDNFRHCVTEPSQCYSLLQAQKQRLGLENHLKTALRRMQSERTSMKTAHGPGRTPPTRDAPGASLHYKESGSSVDSTFFQQVHGSRLFRPKELNSLVRLSSGELYKSVRKDSSNDGRRDDSQK